MLYKLKVHYLQVNKTATSLYLNIEKSYSFYSVMFQRNNPKCTIVTFTFLK